MARKPTKDAPLTNGENGPSPGRDRRGRFAGGNRAAVGHSTGLAAKVAKLRAALVAAVSEEDIRRIADALVKRAADGDPGSIKLLFAYVLGRPVEHDVFARLESLENLAAEIRESGA